MWFGEWDIISLYTALMGYRKRKLFLETGQCDGFWTALMRIMIASPAVPQCQ
jgi:hypothetical protein